MDWMQIGSALALVMFLIILFPTALEMMKNSSKATFSDWKVIIVLLIITDVTHGQDLVCL